MVIPLSSLFAISVICVCITIRGALFVSGPLEGLRCDSEAVHFANSAQLKSILSELTDTTFFRLVRVGEDGYCPIESLRPNTTGDASTCGAVVDSFTPFSPGPAASFGDPQAAPVPNEESLCSVLPEFSAQEVAEIVVTSKSPEELSAETEFPRDNDCVVEGTLQIRPDYWLDICAQSTTTHEYVNMKVNPERNTGYNGTTVWEEMHREVSLLKSPEGKILSKLISGYHTSVSTQIMWSYFPPKRKSDSTRWLPNYAKYAEKVFVPERIKNMQFAFVVVARSLFKIKDWLYEYQFTTGNTTADAATKELMNHLLDSSVMAACDSVLSGFDESVMFRTDANVGVLASDFKKSFRRLHRLVNCVTCHRCKLHASVAMHGIGAAIKILLTPDSNLVTSSLSRDDVVALVNTLEKFSESMELGHEMMTVYQREHSLAPARPNDALQEQLLLEVAGAKLDRTEEDALVHAILVGDAKILLLAKTFTGLSFVRHALISLGVQPPDAVIVGGGLAGLVAAISIADRGGSVVLLEKEGRLGGNSAKASSGINTVWTPEEAENFLADTLASQGGSGNPKLAEVLVRRANSSVAWLEEVTGLRLKEVGQLGGHSVARTWRPEQGVVGAELMAALMREVKRRGVQIEVRLGVTVTKLLVSGERGETAVTGVLCEDGKKLFARNVLLASGGFGFDTRSLLLSYRPDLVGFPTTLGSHTTGDGIGMAAAVGADLVDMEHVQLHPTGFVDPANPDARTKVLAAELLRGVGGILLHATSTGVERFVNELGTRKHVTDAMLSFKKKFQDSKFYLLLSAESAALAGRLATVYVSRGLMRNVTSAEGGDFEMFFGSAISKHTLADVLVRYDSLTEDDSFGRKDRQGRPLASSPWYLIAEVTPVVHYTMGGVRVDKRGSVLRKNGSVIPNLFAAGEVAGGVHGKNRLGGNSLLECTVFGRLIGGESIRVREEFANSFFPRRGGQAEHTVVATDVVFVSIEEVAAHATVDDCWTIINGKVFDLSKYATEHPGGIPAIAESCGVDSTSRFLTAHSLGLLEDMDFFPIGHL